MEIICECGLKHNGEKVITNPDGVETRCPCCKRIWVVRESVAHIIRTGVCGECWESNRTQSTDNVDIEEFERRYIKMARDYFLDEE